MTCYTCESNKGIKRISPGPTIHEGKYWNIEHAYPSTLLGWLVAVTKEHTEQLSELDAKAYAELGKLLEITTKQLHEQLQSEKEYVMCLAEKEGFKHIHFHIIPKPRDLPLELTGAKIFAMLKIPEEEAIPKEIVREFCEKAQGWF